MERKFVSDEIAEKFTKIFGVSIPNNDIKSMILMTRR